MDPFKVLLVDIAKDIDDEDLEVLKYFSEDVLTARSIDGINSPTDLFTKLQVQLGERGLKAFLYYVFSITKNSELRNKLGMEAEDGWPQGKLLRVLLYEISEELDDTDWKNFKFLLPAEIKTRDKEKRRIAILSVLMKRLPEHSLVEYLEKNLKSLERRDLLEKLNRHKNARETIIYKRNPMLHPEECSSTLCTTENASSNLYAEECGYEQSSNNNNQNRSIQDVDENLSVCSPHSTNKSGNAIDNNKGLDETSESDTAQLKQQPTTPILQPNQQPGPSAQSSYVITIGRFSYDPHHIIDQSLSVVVYKGMISGVDIAVKVGRTDDFLKRTLKECDILKDLEKQNVQQHFLKYYGYETRGNAFCLGLELYTWTLKDYIKENKLEKEEAKQKCRSLAKGVQFLHSKNIMHRGISPYNIFVIEYPRETLFKIGNLGSCERIDSRNEITEDGQNCLKYIAKEVLEELDRTKLRRRRKTLIAEEVLDKHDKVEKVDYVGQLNFSFKADIFALGCVFYFILTNGHHPYGRTNLSDDKSILMGCNPVLKELNKFTDFHFIELIKCMISHRKEDRPTAARVCIYPAFMKDHDIMSMYFEVSNKLNGNIQQRQRRKFEDQSILPGRNPNWLDYIPVKKLKSTLIENTYAKYDGGKVESLLRAIRNTKSHLRDWSKNVQKNVQDFPGGILAVWTVTCPKLLVHVYDTVRELGKEPLMLKELCLEWYGDCRSSQNCAMLCEKGAKCICRKYQPMSACPVHTG